MVLPAPAPDDPQGAPRPPWIERVVDVVGASRRGVLLLARAPNDGPLGALTRALLRAHPDLVVTADPAVVERCGDGAVVIYAPDPAHAPGLNLARPLYAQRALRVVLWARPATIRALARDAPDFFDWISHRVEVPWAVAPFAAQGLRASLALGVGVDWRGPHLEAAIRALEPAAPIVRVDPAIEWERLVAQVNDAPPGAWLVFDVARDERRARRATWVVAACARDARSVVRQLAGAEGYLLRTNARVWGVRAAEAALVAARVERAGLIAALLDLEPEAIALCCEFHWALALDVVQRLTRASDPGVALEDSIFVRKEEDVPELLRRGLQRLRVTEVRRVAAWPTAREAATRLRLAMCGPLEQWLRDLRDAPEFSPAAMEREALVEVSRVARGHGDVEAWLAKRWGTASEAWADFRHAGFLAQRDELQVEALAHFDRLALTEPLLVGEHLRAMAMRWRGQLLTVLARYEEAERSLYDASLDDHDTAFDVALARASLWCALGEPRRASPWVDAAVASIPEAVARELRYRAVGKGREYMTALLVGALATTAGECALLHGALAEAASWFERSAGSAKDYVLELRGMALVDAATGRHREALERFDKALSYARSSLRSQSVSHGMRRMEALVLLDRGELLRAVGRFDVALADLSESVDLYTSLFHERHHGVGLARLALGRLHLRTARYGDARAELELARSILEEVVRPPRPDAVRARVELVRLDRIERVADAQATRARLVAEAALLADSLGEEHPEVVALRAEAAAP